MAYHLVIIDPQFDFVDPSGSLAVPGARGDMQRLAAFIDSNRHQIADIHVSMDSHQVMDIAHPHWWADDAGMPAKPFTVVTNHPERDDLFVGTEAGGDSQILRTRRASDHGWTRRYVQALGVEGRYPHLIWPEHCLTGTEGASIDPTLGAAVNTWARETTRNVYWLTKGENPQTEHFSAVTAEVVIQDDPTTDVNAGFVARMRRADQVLLAGEALSHCVANTGRDLLDNLAHDGFGQRLTLLTDATSNVPGFEDFGEAFLSELSEHDARLATTGEVTADRG